MLHYKNHIILDNLDSWPKPVINLLDSNFDLLRAYLIEEIEIDEKCRTDDLEYRLNPPNNSWMQEWEDLTEKIKIIIQDCLFCGFHCTRLAESEIEDIQSNGLKPLCPDFNKKRLEKLLKDNFISLETAQEIMNENESSISSRIGQVCFSHCLSTLTEEHYVYRLFRSWGGEAIYVNRENALSGKELRHIGIPCIIVGILDYSDIAYANSFRLFEERIINIWANYYKLCKGIPEDNEFDSFIKKDVQIIDIIKYDNPLFEQLTNSSTWTTWTEKNVF